MNINGLVLELNDSNHTAIISYSPEAKGDILVSRSYQGYVVVSIAKKAFKLNQKIKSIKFSENSGLLKISKRAFYDSSIEYIYIPSSLQELENGWSIEANHLDKIIISPKNKFYSNFDENLIIGKSIDGKYIDYDTIIYCKKNVKNITIPSFIKHIASFAFNDCEKLDKIAFLADSKLLSIGKSAFSFTNIQSLSIPNSVECLKDGWCRDTLELKNVYISSNNSNFKYLDDEHKVILSKSDKNNKIYDVISFASRDITEIDIPSYITCICSDSFSRCIQLESVIIHKDSLLKSIGKLAFFQTSIKHIFIPKHVLKISKECFMDIDEEFTIEFDNESDLLSIEKYAFNNTNINKISITSHVQSIGNNSFSCCDQLTQIDFPFDSELLTIGINSFFSTGITTLVLPERVKEIKKFAFSQCKKLQLVDFSNNKNLKVIEENLFSFSTVEKIILSKYIVKINDCAFYKCLYLEDIIIPDDSELVSIGSNSLSGTQIIDISFPQYLEEIKESWCYYTPNIYNISISPYNKNFAFYDHNHCIVLGKSNINEDKFDSIVLVKRSVIKITIPSFIKYLCSCSLSSCEILKKVEFEKNSQLISIGTNAFSSSFFKYITIPQSTNIIGKEAFKHCFLIDTIEFLGENMIIGENCFESCSNLTLISFPNTRTIKFINSEFYDVSESLSIFVCAKTKLT